MSANARHVEHVHVRVRRVDGPHLVPVRRQRDPVAGRGERERCGVVVKARAVPPVRGDLVYLPVVLQGRAIAGAAAVAAVADVERVRPYVRGDATNPGDAGKRTAGDEPLAVVDVVDVHGTVDEHVLEVTGGR